MNMRRQDRAMTHEESVEFLRKTSHGVLALVDGNQPYAVPMNHYYADGHLYFHSAPAGHKLDVIAANPAVCYTVGEMDLLQGSKNGLLCGFGAFFHSVICLGEATVITDPEQKASIFTDLTRHIAGEAAAGMPDITPEQASAVVLLDVHIHSLSGKANVSHG